MARAGEGRRSSPEAEAGPCGAGAALQRGSSGAAPAPAPAPAMDRYALLLSWGPRRDGPVAAGAAAAVYEFLQSSCTSPLGAEANVLPACSAAGIPCAKKWYFASHVICGSYQFCSSDWEEITSDSPKHEESLQTSIDRCLAAVRSFEEDSSGGELPSVADVYDEAADSLHQLADKLPAPGRALVDVILQAAEPEGPKLKDCLAALGALKHLREWHSAQITVTASDSRGWRRIAEYLSADLVSSGNITSIIDTRDLWRGKIQIREKKFESEITFPEFCMKSTSAKASSTSPPSSCSAVKPPSRNADASPEAFHYYGPALEFLQLVVLSDLPPFFISGLEFELSLARKSKKGASALLLDQISSLSGKVGALFTLPCHVSSAVIPSPAQLSSKKWKEYMARRPKVIAVPEVELKGESCRYYFLLQGNGCGGCKATLIHSASQINGAATLAAVNRKLRTEAEDTESGLPIADFIESLPRFRGEEIVQREKQLLRLQASALKEYLRRKELAEQPPVISADEFKALLELTRECFLELCHASPPRPVPQKAAEKARSCSVPAGCGLMEPDPLEWPERQVLQNLENLEKKQQKTRVSLFAHSAEPLLGHRDSQRESLTLDAKELLKHFTPEGLPTGDLQPLHIPRRENPFRLTPELTPRKLRALPFQEAAGCQYHGLEYCLDTSRALERDAGYAELQTRLIRYETQTTCAKECCPVPVGVSPLPSPAVLSEPGSVPDGESLQSEFRAEAPRLTRRSRDPDGFHPRTRLAKPESTDSPLSQASVSSGSHCAAAAPRRRSERASSSASAPQNQPGPPRGAAMKLGAAGRVSTAAAQPSKPAKESRSQKHTRMLKEVVAKTLAGHGITEDHKCFASCSQRLFEISKFYLKDLKTSRGLLDEMKRTASDNVKQVIEWVLEKTGK